MTRSSFWCRSETFGTIRPGASSTTESGTLPLNEHKPALQQRDDCPSGEGLGHSRLYYTEKQHTRHHRDGVQCSVYKTLFTDSHQPLLKQTPCLGSSSLSPKQSRLDTTRGRHVTGGATRPTTRPVTCWGPPRQGERYQNPGHLHSGHRSSTAIYRTSFLVGKKIKCGSEHQRVPPTLRSVATPFVRAPLGRGPRGRVRSRPLSLRRLYPPRRVCT